MKFQLAGDGVVLTVPAPASAEGLTRWMKWWTRVESNHQPVD